MRIYLTSFSLKFGEEHAMIGATTIGGRKIWGCGAVGSALESHSRGRGFEPP